jgi:hypothetical protein
MNRCDDRDKMRIPIRTRTKQLRPYLSFLAEEVLQVIFSYTGRQSSDIKIVPWISILLAPAEYKNLIQVLHHWLQQNYKVKLRTRYHNYLTVLNYY